MVIVVVVLFNDTLVTATDAEVTVTVQDAVLFPSVVLTVIVAVPTALAVTKPLLLTVAILALLLLQVNPLFVAFVGKMVHVNCSVPLMANVVEVLFNDTLATDTAVVETVTLQDAVLPPLFVFTVIVAVPIATAETTPELLTVATLVLLLSHVTSFLEASSGNTVALSIPAPPTVKLNVVWSRITSVTFTPTADSSIEHVDMV